MGFEFVVSGGKFGETVFLKRSKFVKVILFMIIKNKLPVIFYSFICFLSVGALKCLVARTSPESVSPALSDQHEAEYEVAQLSSSPSAEWKNTSEPSFLTCV